MAIATGQQILAADVLAIRNIFHELANAVLTKVTAAGGANWGDWDISAVVGAKVVAVEVRFWSNANGQLGGVRQNGSAVEHSQVNKGAPGSLTMTCYTDAAGIIEVLDGAQANQYNVMGYWANT